MAQTTSAVINFTPGLKHKVAWGSVHLPDGIRLLKTIEMVDGPIYYDDDGEPYSEKVPGGVDLEAILDMSRAFYATTDDAKYLPMCDQTVRHLIAKCDESVLLIAEHEGVPVGFFAGIIADGMFNGSHKALHEVAWYVNPDFCSLGYGTKLLRAADNARKALHCWKFEKATLATSPPIADKILRSEGFEPSYNSYMKVD